MLNNIALNPMLVNNGVWMPLLRSRFLIASTDSQRFKQSILDHGRNGLTEDDLISIMSKTILLGWADVKDPAGKDLPYSEQMAAIALRQNEAVRTFVDNVSTNIGLYCEQS